MWTPTQVALFVELTQLAASLRDKGKTEAQVLRAMKRRTKQIQKRLAQ